MTRHLKVTLQVILHATLLAEALFLGGIYWPTLGLPSPTVAIILLLFAEVLLGYSQQTSLRYHSGATVIWLIPALFFYGGGNTKDFFACIFLFTATWIVGATGFFAGRILAKKTPSSPNKRRAIPLVIAIAIGFPIVFISAPFALPHFLLWRSSIETARIDRNIEKIEATQLKQTQVVLDLETPIGPGTNLIWCASFQLAWNELTALHGQALQLQEAPPQVARLNKQLVNKTHLDPKTVVAEADFITPAFIRRVNKKLNQQFGKGTFPDMPLENSTQETDIAALAFICINLPFRDAFERFDHVPMPFGTNTVTGFGLRDVDQFKNAAPQVQIFDARNEDDFIIELTTRKTNHHLILAKIAAKQTLSATVQSVYARTQSAQPEKLSPHQKLEIPILDFDIKRDYSELLGKPIGPHGALNSYDITLARQQIRFKLDERGALLKSDAVVCVKLCPAKPVEHYIFDKPFLVMLRYQDHAQPYFALWIDNPEILHATPLP